MVQQNPAVDSSSCWRLTIQLCWWNNVPRIKRAKRKSWGFGQASFIQDLSLTSFVQALGRQPKSVSKKREGHNLMSIIDNNQVFWGGNIQHPCCPLLPISAKLREGLEVWDTKLTSGVWPSWRWMSSTGLLLRLSCQWHTEPKRWFNSALVSNPFPVTHNFLLIPEQLGQPAGEKTYRCCCLELEGAMGLSSVQSVQNASVGYRIGVFPPSQTRHGWRRRLCLEPSLILQYMSLSREGYSSSSFATQRSFISFGNIRSLSQSNWARYERWYSGQNVPLTQMSGLKTDLKLENVWKAEKLEEGWRCGARQRWPLFLRKGFKTKA